MAEKIKVTVKELADIYNMELDEIPPVVVKEKNGKKVDDKLTYEETITYEDKILEEDFDGS